MNYIFRDSRHIFACLIIWAVSVSRKMPGMAARSPIPLRRDLFTEFFSSKKNIFAVVFFRRNFSRAHTFFMDLFLYKWYDEYSREFRMKMTPPA